MRPLRLRSTLSIVLLVGFGLAQPAARAAFPGSNGKIAFISYRDGNCEIYTANPDGTAQTNVSTNAASDDMPAWSPDGTKIAFTSDRTGSFEIFVMNADGSNVTQLTSDAATFDWEPAWSGDGTKIVFTREGSGEQGLYIVPAGGGAATRLTDGHNPDWSPDGTKIAFTNYRFDQGDTSAEIYTIAPNGAGLTRITNNDRIDVDVDWSPDGTKLAVSRFDMPGDVAQNLGVWVMSANGTGATKVSGADPAWDPAWSPNGKRIAYQGYVGTNWDVFTIPAAGGIAIRVTTTSDVDAAPDWQPQAGGGTTNGRIAFTSHRDGNFEIYSMKADGSGQQRLTNDAAMDDYTAWSPDGEKIAFTSWRDGNAEIYVMDHGGTGVTRLTNDPGYDAEPTWSPDGTEIAFVSGRSGDDDLWVMNADGSGEQLLFGASSVSEFSPDWSADGIAFVSDRDGNNEIYEWDPATPSDPAVRLTNDTGSDYSPSWAPSAPDATFHHILFVRGAPGEGDLWDLTLEGTETQVTTTPKWEFGTDWSPDGNWLLYSRAAVGDPATSQVWKMSPEGVETQLTTVADGNFNPDMQPCPGGTCPGGGGGTTVKHARSLTLKLFGGLTASGRLSAADGFRACEAQANIQIQREVHGVWKTVRSTTTGAQGHYERAIPHKDGRYRARAKRFTAGSDVCSLAISGTVRHM